MYEIKDGILYKDGKKTFVLGESYYPSFHPSKYPVPPEGDRIGEMQKDLRMMAEAGFNHVRFAALGDVSYNAEAESVDISSPFVDSMIMQAQKNDLSVSVRLQGFSVNLRGFTDSDILDAGGNLPHYAWCDFVRSCPNHAGILEDNYIYSRDLARHYSLFPNVIGAQIYNEPKYPQPDHIVCDYHPHAVEAFRSWLVKHNVLTSAEAENYTPPRSRAEQSPRMWALWRIFSTESMQSFLANASDGVKAGSSLPTFTCFNSDMGCKTNPIRGTDAFANAKQMDVVGYTIYKHAWGAEYYPMCLDGDAFQSAAELEGKEAWCIELDSRTYIPSTLYNRGTYTTIGSGVKGIVYYQWRGDYPAVGVPFPNSCGILNYDGTKTKNFENAVAVNRWIHSVSDLLLGAQRAHEGVGLLYSAYSIAYCDALENRMEHTPKDSFFNATVTYFNHLYIEMRKAGYTVTITDAEHLVQNKFGIKALVVADIDHISPEERAILEKFYDEGGEIYYALDPSFPTHPLPRISRFDRVERTYPERVYLPPYTVFDLPAATGLLPTAISLECDVGVQTLCGEDYTLLVLTNISCARDTVDARIRVNIPFQTATFTAIDGEKTVEIRGNEITIKGISDGGIVVLR